MKRRMPKEAMRQFGVMICSLCLLSMLAGCSSEETMRSEDMVQSEDIEQAADADPTTDTGQAANTEQTQTDQPDIFDEIDEETRTELTMELLKENELDTSVLENTKTTKGCIFDLPEEFEELEDTPGMFVTNRYPIDASSIYYGELDQDISMQLLTEETFLQRAKDDFKKQFGMDTDINLERFENFTLDGYPAFRIVLSYMLDDIEITQTEYVINADKSYCIIYSQTNEYDRTEEYALSAATIRIVY